MRLPNEAQALVELGKKIRDQKVMVSQECPKTQSKRISQAIAAINSNNTLSNKQKARGIAALERARLRMRLQS